MTGFRWKWLPLAILALLTAFGAAARDGAAGIPHFEVSIQDRQVPEESRLLRVTRGDRVTLVWTTDEPVQLHLHGYDLEFEVTPGKPVTREFVAHATGRFPVTSHGFSGEGHGHETLLYLEVYPE